MKLNQMEIKKLLQKDNLIILEIGSHIGTDTMRFLEAFRDIKIFCFEPDPRCIIAFKNFINDERCILIEAAVSNIDGKTILNMSGGWPPGFPGKGDWDASSSIKNSISHSDSHPWLTFNNKIEVITIKLDTWATENDINFIDFIWADVQGAERDLIEGAGHTLKITKYFFTEYGETSTYPEAMTREETIELLQKHGFELVPIYSDESEAGNLLFMNRMFS
jgi:FkbM family methyltransferase